MAAVIAAVFIVLMRSVAETFISPRAFNSKETQNAQNAQKAAESAPFAS